MCRWISSASSAIGGIRRAGGGEEDRFHPGSVSSVNFCFGAWLFGDEAGLPHGVEIERVELVRRPAGDG